MSNAVIQTERLTHRYGRVVALADVDLVVPAGAIYALLGPNGAGKTTLLQLLMHLRRATAGRAMLLGKDTARLTLNERASIGYLAESQTLPGWMRLDQLEAYLAPLYDTWDFALANELRRRFRLDRHRKIRTFSRGEQTKAALLCTLAPRPRLLLLDEPFIGMDALVKDELVRGLLESASSEGWSMLISSHDLSELESLADWVGFLERGRLLISEPMDDLRERFHHVDVIGADNSFAPPFDAGWLSVERSGQRLSFVVSDARDGATAQELRQRFPAANRIEARPASLREIFVALASAGTGGLAPGNRP